MFPPQHNEDPDAPVRSTDNDAALARLSAVQKGYLQDPFVRHLVPRAHLQPPRPPLINIGTYVRTSGIDTLVDEWLHLGKQSGKKCQIVSLGAGSDTRFWRIATGAYNEELSTYIEVDFPEIVTKKAMAIRKSKDMSQVLGEAKVAGGGTALHSAKYHLLSGDLRSSPSAAFGPLFTNTEHDTDGQPLLSPSLPTLILFECVLAYMSPEISSRLLEWFVNYTKPSEGGILGCVIYEMFKLNDSFGRVMLANLQTRNVALPGALPFNTLESLSERLMKVGFTAARAVTLREIRKDYTKKSELEWIAKLEFLDETEELDLVLDHYAISWGLRLESDAVPIWGHWGMKERPA
ncbi:leucine carboxyl methyltransferase [Coprinopsis marcescibilis]|uniref:Leucine carboxyl methyltransferase 1 n=1 Tax=Coprinopsis marcescibilis TaxID=230819 RepID=A0A5C3KSA9_COPMA|nr:leucine carboxyl methyltransferase [Coprinopsis marcescibilis]